MGDDFMALLEILWLYNDKCLVDSWKKIGKYSAESSRGLIKVMYHYLTRRHEESTKNRSLIGDDRPVIEPEISRAQVCNRRYGKLFGPAVSIYKFICESVYVCIYLFIYYLILHKYIYTV